MAKWCIRCTRRIEKIIGFQSANGKPRSLRGSGFYRGVRERPLPISTMAAMFFRMAHPNRTHARNIANAPFGPHDCDWIFGSSSANREPGPLRGSGFYRGVRERPLPISTMAAMFSESRIQTVPMPAILQTPRLVRIAAIGFSDPPRRIGNQDRCADQDSIGAFTNAPYQFRRWRPCFSEWRIQTVTMPAILPPAAEP